MFHSVDIKCEICGCVMMASPCFDNDKEEFKICSDCEKAVKDATEQRKYLNFFKLQQTIKKAEAAGISHRQMADTVECAVSTIDRYLRGVSQPMPRVCIHMTKMIEDLINGV